MRTQVITISGKASSVFPAIKVLVKKVGKDTTLEQLQRLCEVKNDNRN
jgi:hypothetical protein